MGSLTPAVAMAPGSAAMATGASPLSKGDGAARPTGFTDSAGDALGVAALELALALSSVLAAPGTVCTGVPFAGDPGGEPHAPIAIAQHRAAAQTRRGEGPFLQRSMMVRPVVRQPHAAAARTDHTLLPGCY